MTDDELKSYLETRHEPGSVYYDMCAKRTKRWHDACFLYVLVVSVALPPLLGVNVAIPPEELDFLQ